MNNIFNYFSKFRSHSLFKKSSIVLIGSMIANVCAYLYHLFVGRILGPEKYGELSAMLSLFFILNVPAVVMQTVLVKFFSILKAQNEIGQSKKLYFLVTKYMVIFGLIGLIVIIPFIRTFSNFMNISSPLYFIWLYFIILFQILMVINASVLQAYQYFTPSMIYTNINMGLRLFLGVVSAFFGVGWTLISNVCANITGYLIYFFSFGFLFKSKPKSLVLSKQKFISYSIPTFFTLLGITALYSQDVVLVKHFLSSHEAGLYASLSVLGRIIFFATSAVVYVLFPILSEKKEKGHPTALIIHTGLLFTGLTSIILTVMYFVFPDFFIQLLYGKAYLEAAPVLGYFGIFITFISLSNLLTNISLALGDTLIWIFTLSATFIQLFGVSYFHQSLLSITYVNATVSTFLFLVLYGHYFIKHVYLNKYV